MGLLFRFWQIFWGLVPPIVLMVRDYHLSLIMGDAFDWHTPERRRRARKLVRRFARLGPTFIKLAQVLAARADLFPGIYLEELRQLHDRVPPMSTRRITRQFRKATGRRVEEVFEFFDPQPIASASLGQVHRARYRGRTVAVKILKPGIRRLVEKDLRVLAAVFTFTTLFFQSSQLESLITIFEEFSSTIYEEMDLALEAEHVEYFRRRYAGDERVVIPEVVKDLSNRDVLVLEFLEGIPIHNVDEVCDAGHNTDTLINRLVTIFCEQILRDGIFHADPHPGNIFVNARGQICLVDFGLVIRVTKEQRRKYIDAILAAMREDYNTLISLAFELKLVRSDANPLLLRQVAQRLMSISLRDDFGPVQMQRIAHQVMQVFYEFPVQLPGDLVYVFKTMSLIEGLGALYRPGYNLLKDALPLLRELLRPELEQFERSFADRIVQEGKEAWNFYEHMKLVAELAAREELAIRIYRGDIAEIERLLGYMMRRLIALAIVFSGGLTASIIFLATGNWWVLILGSIASFSGMVFLLLMPTIPRIPKVVLPRRRG